jgi:hypothetical protein
LKKDTSDIINEKVYNLPKAGKEAIEEWDQKMLKKGFIQQSNSKYSHATFTVPKKDGTFKSYKTFAQLTNTQKRTPPLYPASKMQ